jgi:hypothetical protein
VEVDAGTAGATRGRGGRDVDRAVERLQEAPEDRGGAVTEDRALAAGEDGGHEAPVEAQAPMADGVDAAVNAVEAAAGDSTRNRALIDTRLVEQRDSDRTVLARCDPRHRRVTSVDFLSHSESKSTGAWILPP